MGGPPRPRPCPSPARACKRSSIHWNILVGAPASFSSIHCNWPLNSLSHFWGAVQRRPFPCDPIPASNVERETTNSCCQISEQRSTLGRPIFCLKNGEHLRFRT